MADVISHTRPRRKRGGWSAYIARRVFALAITITAIGAASWLSPQMRSPGETPFLPEWVETRSDGQVAEALLLEVNVALDLNQPAAPRRAQTRRARGGIPLDAAAEVIPDGYEILSAAELDAISQARD